MNLSDFLGLLPIFSEFTMKRWWDLPKSFCLQPNKTQLGPYLFHLFHPFPALSPSGHGSFPPSRYILVSSPFTLFHPWPLWHASRRPSTCSATCHLWVYCNSVYMAYSLTLTFFSWLSPPLFWSLSLLSASDGKSPSHLFSFQLADCLSAVYCWVYMGECSIHFVCCTGVVLYIW